MLPGVLFVLAAVAAAFGCYNPHVVSGQLRCAVSGTPCPDGFSCAGGVCVSGASGLGGGSGAGGAGGAGGTSCAAPIQPLCTPTTVSGVCDAVCQTGCPCGQRCVVSTSGLKCVAPTGALTLGSVCTPEADACAPGLTCLQEACGTDLGRCYRFCRPEDNECGATGVCGTPVRLPDNTDTLQRVCDLGAQACDPYAGTGCVDPALGCYALGPSLNVCDCPSGVNAPEGAACVNYNDCAAGLACLQLGGGTGGYRCVKLCEVLTDCPTSTCMPFAAAYGYCMLAN